MIHFSRQTVAPLWLPAYMMCLLLLVLPVTNGCGDEGEDDGEQIPDISVPDEPDTGHADIGDPGGEEPAEDLLFPQENFFIYSVRRPRDNAPIQSTDLVVTEQLTSAKISAWKTTTNPNDLPNLTNLTNPSEEESGQIDCSLGCRLDWEGRWLLYRTIAGNEQELRVVPVSGSMGINFNSSRVITTGANIRKATFAGDAIVYSIGEGGTSGVLEVRAQKINGNGSDDHLVKEIPGIAGFTTDPRRPRVVTFAANLACMNIRVGNAHGDPDLKLVAALGENCGQSAGTPYSGNEPAAISPDGRFLAIVVGDQPPGMDSRWLRLLTIPLDANEPGISSEFRLGASGNRACEERLPAEYTFVRDLEWGPEGDSVFALASADCSLYDVAETDVLRVSVDESGALSNLVNLTNNPKAGMPWAFPIESFRLSPQGRWMVMVGAPDDRRRDREVFIMSTSASQAELSSIHEGLIRLTDNSQYQTIVAHPVASR